MFLSHLKKTFAETVAIHRFIYENTPFYEDSVGVDQKNYNNLQIGVLKAIATLKFGGDIQKFLSSPEAKKVMELYREFVKEQLPFLLTSPSNPSFNFKDEGIISEAAKYIIGKLYNLKSVSSAF